MAAAFSVAAKRGAEKRRNAPGGIERLRAGMLANRAASTPEMVAKQNAGRDQTVMGWCPLAYRELNRQLRRKAVPLADRKRMIAEAIVADERARLSAMTPFERQLEAVRTGRARIIDKPNLRPTGPAYSLVGNSMGML